MSTARVLDNQSSDPDRRFPVRRPSFDDMLAGLDVNFVTDGDVIMSHVVAALSGVFPGGEEMFVDSVKHFRGQVTDIDLQQQVNAFIGQESVHGREHRALNRRLAELGYRSKHVERLVIEGGAIPPIIPKTMIKLGILNADLYDGATGQPPPMFMLALTAALEHYTATMATLLLTSADLQSRFANRGFFRLWAWHALEEIEHKTVAFDVYKAVGGDEDTRCRAMKLAGMQLTFIAGSQAIAGVLTDRRSWQRGPGNLFASVRRIRHNPLFSKEFRAQLKDYYRPDFHPLDHDNSTHEASWRSWFDEGASGVRREHELG